MEYLFALSRDSQYFLITRILRILLVTLYMYRLKFQLTYSSVFALMAYKYQNAGLNYLNVS